MSAEYYKRLVDGYLAKTLTKEELAIFFNLLPSGELDPYLESDMDNNEPLRAVSMKGKRGYSYLRYAAILLLVGLAGLGAKYYYGFDKDETKVMPGSEYAILTMADGTKMVLDTNIKGQVEAENGLSVSKLADGTMRYDLSRLSSKNPTDLTTKFSKVETPRGGMYQLVLSDGTKVWLNASSNIKFPLIFKGGKRIVEIVGEVYFEVANNANQPFIVKSAKQEISVLGTKFNVSAYHNEFSTRTSLLEGSIAINAASETKLIRPGQQAVVNSSFTVSDGDVDSSISWKDGYFTFDKMYVKDIMRQVERWYNIDVIYDGSFKDERFVAKIKRSSDINALISIFNEGGLDVKLKGRELLVSNSVN
jgi:transmembrane sensor